MLHLSQRFIYKCYIRNNHQVYMAACSDPAKIGNRFNINNKYIGDSKYITIKRSIRTIFSIFKKGIRTILSISKKASELGEICWDYITIHKGISLKWHKQMRTCHKHLRLNCDICFMPFAAEVFTYCSHNSLQVCLSISLGEH